MAAGIGIGTPNISTVAIRRIHRGTSESRASTPNIKIPTLLIRGGSSDVVSPEGVQDFLNLLPTAKFIDVADAGHMVAGDKNDIFTDAVVDFLGQTFTDHAAA